MPDLTLLDTKTGIGENFIRSFALIIKLLYLYPQVSK